MKGLSRSVSETEFQVCQSQPVTGGSPGKILPADILVRDLRFRVLACIEVLISLFQITLPLCDGVVTGNQESRGHCRRDQPGPDSGGMQSQ